LDAIVLLLRPLLPQHRSWSPTTDVRTQQSLALDMQALYGYRSA